MTYSEFFAWYIFGGYPVLVVFFTWHHLFMLKEDLKILDFVAILFGSLIPFVRELVACDMIFKNFVLIKARK